MNKRDEKIYDFSWMIAQTLRYVRDDTDCSKRAVFLVHELEHRFRRLFEDDLKEITAEYEKEREEEEQERLEGYERD